MFLCGALMGSSTCSFCEHLTAEQYAGSTLTRGSGACYHFVILTVYVNARMAVNGCTKCENIWISLCIYIY